MKHVPMYEVLGITREEYQALSEIRDELKREEYPKFDMRCCSNCIMGIARHHKGREMRHYGHEGSFNKGINDLFYPGMESSVYGQTQKQAAERLDRYLTMGKADLL